MKLKFLSVPRIWIYMMSSAPCLKHVCAKFDNIEIRLSFAFFFLNYATGPIKYVFPNSDSVCATGSKSSLFSFAILFSRLKCRYPALQRALFQGTWSVPDGVCVPSRSGNP